MDILFWSGGKDSYLALEFFKQEYDFEKLKLLTTYNEENNRITHQELDLSTIRKQAEFLERDLITVPLPPDCPNERYIDEVQQALEQENETIRYLIFGDWYLEDIRRWREKVFGEMGYECLFPIWKKSLDELWPVLFFKPVEVKISAVADEHQKFLRVGEPYNQKLIRQLPDQIDPMGENGEFHTEIIFQEPEAKVKLKQPL